VQTFGQANGRTRMDGCTGSRPDAWWPADNRAVALPPSRPKLLPVFLNHFQQAIFSAEKAVTILYVACGRPA
jgi:hypothetical protein